MAESKRIGDRAYVDVDGSYDSYVITKHLGGKFYQLESEFDSLDVRVGIITGKLVTDSIEAVEPYAAVLVPDEEGIDALYHAGGTINVWVKLVAMSGNQALIRGTVLKGGQQVVPSKQLKVL